MNQLNFAWLTRAHPRSLYLTACKKLKKEAGEDYFNNKTLHIVDSKSKELDKVIKIIKGQTFGKGDNEYRDAFAIYHNFDRRVFVESCLYNLQANQASRLTEIPSTTLALYKKIFFDLKDFSKKGTKDLFIASIENEEVSKWFLASSKMTIEELEYTFRGKQQRPKVAEGLEKMFQKALNDYTSLTNLPAQTLIDGPKAKDSELFDMGIKAGKLATNLAKVLFQYNDLVNKTEDSFMKEWELVIQSDSPEKYNTPDTQELVEQKDILKPYSGEEDINQDLTP